MRKKRPASTLWTQKVPTFRSPTPLPALQGSSIGCVLRTPQTGSCTAHTSSTSSGFPQLACTPYPAPPPASTRGQRPLVVIMQKQRYLLHPACLHHTGVLPLQAPRSPTPRASFPHGPHLPRPPERPMINLHALLQLGPRHHEARPLRHQPLGVARHSAALFLEAVPTTPLPSRCTSPSGNTPREGT